jgi:hypothetical protein
VLAFLLGTLAGAVKSELELPEAVVKLLAIYLLFSLGLTGGRELAKADMAALWPLLAITLLMTFAIPSLAYVVTRRLGRMDISNAAAIAAHYGSVSTATFFASMSFATAMGTPAEGYMAAMVALMEFGVIYSLVLARVALGRKGNARVNASELFMSVIRGRGILLLIGGMTIGYIATDKQWQQISPFYEGLFRGMLMLFLLEMGITASRQIKAFGQVGVFMAGFGMLMPVLHGIVGVSLAHGAGLSVGGMSRLGVIRTWRHSGVASFHCVIRHAGSRQGRLACQHRPQGLQRVRLMQRFVIADAQHAREANGHAALVARAGVQALEAQLEHQAGRHAAHRAELLQRGGADDLVHPCELGVAQAGVGLGEGHQLQALRPGRLTPADGLHHRRGLGGIRRRAAPHREGVVRVHASAPAVAGLGVDQHRVHGQRVHLPLPPEALGLGAAAAVARGAVLEHEALHAKPARALAQRGAGRPIGHLHLG